MKNYILLFLIYLAIVLVMFFPVTANMTTTVPGIGEDVYQVFWNLWWVPHAVFTLHASPYFTRLMYYPVGANLLVQPMIPLAGLLASPLLGLGLPFTYNLIFFLGFAITGLGAYILAFHITKNKFASFLAGFIYEFTPLHVAQSSGHLQWAVLGFLPLFVLSYIRMLKEKKQRYVLLSAIFFLLLTFMGDLEQTIIAGLFVVFIDAYYVIRKDDALFVVQGGKKILDSKAVLLSYEFLFLTLLLGSPAFIPMASGVLGGVINEFYLQSGGNWRWSTDLLGFFVPSYLNPLTSAFITQSSGVYGNGGGEKVAYVGYSVLFLALFAIYRGYKKKTLGRLGVFIFTTILFILLSLGPYIQINGQVTAIPGPYLLYENIPVLDAFREPGRFIFAAALGIAVLAAVGFDELTKLKGKNAFLNDKNLLFSVFLLLIFIEYEATPSPPLLTNYTAIPSFYYQTRDVMGNYTLLTLPTLRFPYPTLGKYPIALSLYYQTVLNKPMLGGLASRENITQQNSFMYIPIVYRAGCLAWYGNFTYVYPIRENYTKLDLFSLRTSNVSFMPIITKAFNSSELPVLLSYASSLFGSPVYQSNDMVVFSTNRISSSGLAGSPIAYISGGLWNAGRQPCLQENICNSTFCKMWWGTNQRKITVWVPGNKTNVTMGFVARSYQNTSNLSVYLNANTLVGRVTLNNRSVARYSFNMKMNPGINTILLASENNTLSESQYLQFLVGIPVVNLNFGIDNITFT